MTLFRFKLRGPNNYWIERCSYRRKLVSYTKFDITGPEVWSVVSCVLVAILVCQGVSSAGLLDWFSREVGVRAC